MRNPRTGEKFAANDPKNPIGERWIGLQGTTPDTAKFTGYGIHGTWDNSSIGKQATAGCIRLVNDDVAELFTMLPLGTPVTIRE